MAEKRTEVTTRQPLKLRNRRDSSKKRLRGSRKHKQGRKRKGAGSSSRRLRSSNV
jgi:hypothetical protein